MLSLFIDALPYSYLKEENLHQLNNVQISPMIQNVGYSSTLHWELYCNIYPDEHGFFVDWVHEKEKNSLVCAISKFLSFTDYLGDTGVYCRKILDRYVFRKNVFANIPFRFRPYFTNKSNYLFWEKENYGSFELFKKYRYAMQDEGPKTFEENISIIRKHIKNNEKNIFGVFGEIDGIGHKCPRGNEYNKRVNHCMDIILDVIQEYNSKFPNEEVLIISDHGMSTIKELVSIDLEKKFGRQSRNNYIAYSDIAIMCVFCASESLKEEISKYLSSFSFGHVLTEVERQNYGITDSNYGDIIFNLKEGYGFKENWFGKSIRRNYDYHVGMHGFWPEWTANDQLASITLINGKRQLMEKYDYKSAYGLINEVMLGE